MKKRLILTGILGLSLAANAAEEKVTVISLEHIQKIAKARKFPDIHEKLLQSQIIFDLEKKEFVLVNKEQLEKQRALALSAKDQDALDILNEVAQGQMQIEKKDLGGIVLSTQDVIK